MPVREKGRRRPGSPPARPFSRPRHPQTAAKVRGFLPIASGFTAETDWLLEESGFEPSVPLLRNDLPGVAEGRSRNEWASVLSSGPLARWRLAARPLRGPVHGETELRISFAPAESPELSLPLSRDDTGVRNSLPPAARVQLRYQFPTSPAIVNEAGAADRDTGARDCAVPFERVGDGLEAGK